MAATPAWPPRSTPRLFVETSLAEGADVRVEGGQAHYLLSVLRLKAGDPVKLFDDATGEWLGIAGAVGITMFGFDAQPILAQADSLKISRTTETRSTCPES